jgi:hypothetical protein
MSEDDDGQVDGDFVSRLPMAGQSWLRGSLPPWHLWGNTQTIISPPSGAFNVVNSSNPNEMVRICYKRPETWHWVFQTRLVDMPTPPIPTSNFNISARYDVTIGIGRSVIIMRDFEVHTWGIRNPALPPIGDYMRSTTAVSKRSYIDDDSAAPVLQVTEISQLVAQDIQVQCRVEVSGSGVGATGTLEVSAMFAPKTHVRPDWLADGPPELQFAGEETAGR